MPGIYKMFCSRLLCEWISLVFLCHVVGHTLCYGVTPLGLERMLALFVQSYAKGGVDLGFPQSSAAVTCYDRAVSQYDRTVSIGRGFRGSFHVNLCRDERDFGDRFYVI